MGCNADSRLTNRWSAAQGNTAYGYYAVGDLLTVTYGVSPNLSYAYDALDRATNRVDGLGTTSYVFAFSRPGRENISPSCGRRGTDGQVGGTGLGGPACRAAGSLGLESWDPAVTLDREVEHQQHGVPGAAWP